MEKTMTAARLAGVVDELLASLRALRGELAALQADHDALAAEVRTLRLTPEWMSVADVCARLEISRTTFYRYEKEGRISVHRGVRSRPVVSRRELQAAIDAGRL